MNGLQIWIFANRGRGVEPGTTVKTTVHLNLRPPVFKFGKLVCETPFEDRKK